MKRLTASAVTLMLLTGPSAMAADPIEGNWKTKSGETALIATCGGSNFCITLKTGEHAGRQIGKMTNAGGTYKGKITDPSNDKTYTGKATLDGSTLKMSGCVLAGLICRSENWQKM
jgi:uncharacterized protein (DUF2147 family)